MRESDVQIFLLKMIILSIPLYLLIKFGDFTPLQRLLALQLSNILKSLGFWVDLKGTVVNLQGFSVAIVKDCLGWKSMLFLSALIISTKAKWTEKTVGIALGIPVLYSLNIFRITVTSLMGFLYGMEVFEFLHFILWQVLMVLFVIALWVMWFRKRSFISEMLIIKSGRDGGRER